MTAVQTMFQGNIEYFDVKNWKRNYFSKDEKYYIVFEDLFMV